MIQNQIWFVTGCSTGFGRVLCETLLRSGKKVAATARDPKMLEGLKAFAKDPSQLLMIKLDVTDHKQIQSSRETAIKHFGHIDVLVNNAGYGAIGALEEVPETEVRRNFETNVFGLIEMTRAFVPHFLDLFLISRQSPEWSRFRAQVFMLPPNLRSKDFQKR
jgi:NAD(P)-dependent dehydrogenase (short-subunit alcohol dehydrogenase family)